MSENKFLNGKKLSFLIIDDEPTVREVISEILKVNGQLVSQAVNGNAGIVKLSKTKIDIILLDIRMPGMLPPEIIKKVKKISPKTLIIYLTSVREFNPTEEDIKKGWVPKIEPPVFGYIEKPISADKLLNNIEKAIKMSKFFKNKWMEIFI